MVEMVLRAANILSVDELEVFRLANRFWQRRSDIKAAFNKYLDKKIVPHWVLHFARNVVQSYERGTFEPAVFGIYPCYETIPLSWALALQTPRAVVLNEGANLFIA